MSVQLQIVTLRDYQVKCTFDFHSRLYSPSPEEKKKVDEEFRRSLLQDYTKGIAERKNDESKIHLRAKSALSKFEKQLSKPSQKEYYTSER